MLTQFGGLKPAELKPEHIIAQIDAWRARGNSPATLYKYGKDLRKWVRRLAMHGADRALMEHVPVVPRYTARTTCISQDEFNALLLHCKPGMRLFLLLCHDGAMRSTAAAQVTPAHFDRSTGCITMLSKGVVMPTPTTARLRETILTLKERNVSMVQQLSPGWVASIKNLRAQWERIRMRAGLSHINLHDLRRSMARDVYLASGDIRVAQRLLGHRSPIITWNYMEAVAEPPKVLPFLEAALLRTETTA